MTADKALTKEEFAEKWGRRFQKSIEPDLPDGMMSYKGECLSDLNALLREALSDFGEYLRYKYYVEMFEIDIQKEVDEYLKSQQQ
jgi:hypothetical protein